MQFRILPLPAQEITTMHCNYRYQTFGKTQVNDGHRRLLALTFATYVLICFSSNFHAIGQQPDFVNPTQKPASSNPSAPVSNKFLIGGYNDGIYFSSFDPVTATLTKPAKLYSVAQSSYLSQHPKLPVVYAVRETMRNDKDKGGAAVCALKVTVSPDGVVKLDKLNEQAIDGDIPCYVSTDRDGKYAFFANYVSGSILVFPIGEDGTLGASTQTIQHEGKGPKPSQSGPRAHCIIPDPTNRWVVAADLGIDKIMVYASNPVNGKLTPAKTPSFSLESGAGPRHIRFSPTGRHAFIINELNSTLTVAAWDAIEGTFTHKATVNTLPQDFKGGNSTAEVLIHPNGKFVYSSNRGHDSIASYLFDEETGAIEATGHCKSGGKTPRNFRITPDGGHVLAENQQSDSIHVLKIDPKTGVLSATGNSTSSPGPTCIEFLRLD